MYTKTIPLLPTHFYLDVVITKSTKKAIKYQHDKYGIPLHILESEPQQINTVAVIESGKRIKVGGTTRIVIILHSFKPATLMHELIHVLWKTSKLSGVELTYRTQEWQALFLEQLYLQITDKSNYKKH